MSQNFIDEINNVFDEKECETTVDWVLQLSLGVKIKEEKLSQCSLFKRLGNQRSRF